jgi:hypothetical protein
LPDWISAGLYVFELSLPLSLSESDEPNSDTKAWVRLLSSLRVSGPGHEKGMKSVKRKT